MNLKGPIICKIYKGERRGPNFVCGRKYMFYHAIIFDFSGKLKKFHDIYGYRKNICCVFQVFELGINK